MGRKTLAAIFRFQEKSRIRARPFAQTAIRGLMLMLVAGCATQSNVSPRQLQLHQNWALQPGSEVGGHQVTGGLGDISIELKGERVKVPFKGTVQPDENGNCVIYSSPEVPAYLFRLCGLNRPKLGDLQAGDVIGAGDYLQFAALRKQPDGTWAMVEPAVDILERMFD